MTLTSQSTWAGLPKVLWLLWCDGPEAAPAVVRACIASWKRHHPSWKIVVISRKNLDSWIDIRAITGHSADDFSPVVLSDLLRLHVLAREGGVWVDATLYCCQPVESWLEPYMTSGFFAFRNPGPDRPLSTWFIAAQPQNDLMKMWRDKGFRYWRHRRYSGNRRFPDLYGWLSRKWERHPHASRCWFRWWIRYGLGMHPYFWAHYLFLQLLQENLVASHYWEQTPVFDASIPHRLQTGPGLLAVMTPATRAEIEGGYSPMYKLTWKFDLVDCKTGSVIDHVIQREAVHVASRPAP